MLKRIKKFVLRSLLDDKDFLITPSNFKQFRMDNNLSMKEISNNTGVSESTISRFENGSNVNYSSIKALLKYKLTH